MCREAAARGLTRRSPSADRLTRLSIHTGAAHRPASRARVGNRSQSGIVGIAVAGPS